MGARRSRVVDRPEHAGRRCEDGEGGPARPVRLAGAGSFRTSCPRTFFRERTSRRSGSSGSTTRRREGRSEVARSSSRRWERGRSSVTFVRNARYWKPHRRTSTAWYSASVASAARPARNSSSCCGTERSTSSGASSSPASRCGSCVACPGCGSSPAPGRAGSTSTFGSGLGGHPSLKRKLVRRALAYGIDRVALARALYGPVDSRYPPNDSAIFLSSTAQYHPNWSAYRFRPRGVPEAARAGGLSTRIGRRLRLRGRAPLAAAGDTRRRPPPAAGARGNPAPAEAGRDRHSPRLCPSGHDVRRDPSERQLRPRDVHVRSPPRTGLGLPSDLYGCGSVQNYSGYCQRLVSRELDQARRILDSSRQAQVLNRADASAREGRAGDPALPEPGGRGEQRERSENVASRACTGMRSRTRRTGGSTQLALAAAIAVSLLAVSGAGGADAQTPKRGGTLVFRVLGPEPACLNVLLTSCRLGGAVLGREGSAEAFRGRSRLHVRGKPRLEGRLHEEATVHADLPHPPGGALERRSPDHGPGLHLHAPGDTPSRYPGAP